jgi:hypothetical protein
VQRTARLACQLLQVRQVNEVVGVVPEAIAPIMAALDDMHSDFRNDEPRPSWHNGKTAETPIRLTEFGL